MDRAWKQILEIKPTLLSSSPSTHPSNLQDLRSVNLEIQAWRFPWNGSPRCVDQQRMESFTVWLGARRESLGRTWWMKDCLSHPVRLQQLFWHPVWSPQRLNLTVQIHNEVCVSVYAFNDLHTGYYFIVASSREREKQDSAIEAVYI